MTAPPTSVVSPGPGAARSELRVLGRLALPVVGSQLSTQLLVVVDTVMLGRFDTNALAAAALASVWVFGTSMLVNGILFGIDPLMAQAHGAKDGERVARSFQRGLVLVALLSPILMLLWAATGPLLLLAGQDSGLVVLAQRYALASIPGAPFLLLYSVLRQYLQCRGIMKPALYVMLIANVANVIGNWIFIYGNLGVPSLGVLGAGLATSLTRAVSFVLLAYWIVRFRLHDGAWVPWNRSLLEWAGLSRIVRVGFPIAVQISTEALAFSASTLIAGRLGAEAIAAHIVVMNLASLSFMMPLGIAIGTTTRVGNLIGARKPELAQRSAWIAMALGAGVMASAALVFVTFRHWLPMLYTPEQSVIAAAAAILPIAAAFQVFDGVQVVGCGVLRGMGRTLPAAAFNTIGYWLIGLPLGIWLALFQGGGLPGIWWGLLLGLAVVAISLVAWIRVRGPAVVTEPIPH